MQKDIHNINKLALTLGFWSALLMIITLLIYSLGLFVFFIFFPLPPWSSIIEYAHSVDSKWFAVYGLLQGSAFTTSPLVLLLINCIHVYADKEKKVLSRTAVGFGIIFTMLSSISHFLQLSVIRNNIIRGQIRGLEQFIQLNPTSIVNGINTLAWTFFLGFTMLCIAFVFSGSRLESWIKYLLISLSIGCFIGGIGFILEFSPFLAFYYLIMSTVFITVLILIIILFWKMIKQYGKHPLFYYLYEDH